MFSGLCVGVFKCMCRCFQVCVKVSVGVCGGRNT